MQRSQYKGERSSCWVTNYHLVGPQESVLLNSWHRKSLKQEPQHNGEQRTRTWNPESRDGGLYLGDGEHHRDRRWGSKNVNGAKDIMEEEKNIQFTKKVGEEIKQWLSALLGCLRVSLTSKFCKTIDFALFSFSPSLIEHVSLFGSPARIPLPANKEIKYFCLSKLRGWLDNTCNLFRWPPIWILEIFVDSAKQTVPSLPYFPCSTPKLALS